METTLCAIREMCRVIARYEAEFERLAWTVGAVLFFRVTKSNEETMQKVPKE